MAIVERKEFLLAILLGHLEALKDLMPDPVEEVHLAELVEVEFLVEVVSKLRNSVLYVREIWVATLPHAIR
jgi:hypothetical protein